MIGKIKNNILKLDKPTFEVLKTSFNTTLIRGMSMLFGILLSILLGRFLGANGLGVIDLSNQIVTILLMVVMLGFPTVILKEISIAYSRKDWIHVESVIKTSLIINGIFAIFIITIAQLLIPYLVVNVFEEPLLKLPLTIAVSAIVFQVISRIYASGLNGYRKIWQSSLVDNSLSLFIVLSSITVQYMLNYEITIVSVAWSYGISRVIVSISIVVYWKQVHHAVPRTNFIPRKMFTVAIPLLLVQATSTIALSIDKLMIAIFMGTEAVGLYSVALRIAFASGFFLQVTNGVLAPRIAEMYANNQLIALQGMIQKIGKGLSIISIVVFILIVFTARPILGVWGDEFQEVYWPLVILSAGQLFHISTGCVGLVLMLCNQEKVWGYVTMSSALLNTILNVVFIKMWGINGAAIATTFNLIYINIFAMILVKKRIKINTNPFIN